MEDASEEKGGLDAGRVRRENTPAARDDSWSERALDDEDRRIPRPAQKRQSGLREAGSRCYLRYGTAYGPMRSRCRIPLTNYSMDPRFSTMRAGCRDVAVRRTAADF